jgi:D-aminopeptidase
VGVLVQTNFGGVLTINGVNVSEAVSGRARGAASAGAAGDPPGRRADGSCMIVVATDAPLDSRNLRRLAARALLGIARTGGYDSNASGDYAIAFSTDPGLRVSDRSQSPLRSVSLLRDERVSRLFQAAAEAAEEAILDSIFKAETTTGKDGRKAEALPLDKLRDALDARDKGRG